MGQFLACMGDGEQVVASLWQSPEGEGTWQAVPVSQRPWEKHGLASAVNFRRPSWDPLGQCVAYPFGEHKKWPMSTCRFYGVLLSAPWQVPKLYRGHQQHVSVVRFSPVVYGGEEVVVVLAMACMDGVISIWLSSHPVPVLLLKDLVDIWLLHQRLSFYMFLPLHCTESIAS